MPQYLRKTKALVWSRSCCLWNCCHQNADNSLSKIHGISVIAIMLGEPYHRHQSWGVGGRDPQILGRGSWGSQGGAGGLSRVVKYYYILSCTGSMLESG